MRLKVISAAASVAGAPAEVCVARAQVLFFAGARDAANVNEAELELSDGADTEEVRRELVRRFPDLQEIMPSCALARNAVYVDGVQTLSEGDEVAVLPPVSGG